jgi:hypothetical protein
MDTDSIGLVVLIVAVVAVLGLIGLFAAAVSISAMVNKLGSGID